ncbi:S-4TM family putative pore-forming effector [Oscillospiraceae bacterium PP1C4]
MVNSIFKRQNDKYLLKCLVAQRKEYSAAKCASAWKSYLTVVFAAISVVASLLDIDMLSAISSLLAIALLVTTRHIDTYTEKHRKHAASIQQYVDVMLYSFVLGSEAAEWGNLPSGTDFAESISVIEDTSLEPVKNWYSDYSSLEPVQQVFYCQKENLRWDFKLRVEFKRIMLCAFAAVLVVLTIASFTVNPSLIKFICTLSWLLPIADFCFSYYSNLQNDIQRLNKMKEKSDSIEQMLSEGDPDKYRPALISLQQQILDSRENAVLVPDWFYRLRQSKHQNDEDKIADVIQNDVVKQNCNTSV